MLGALWGLVSVFAIGGDLIDMSISEGNSLGRIVSVAATMPLLAGWLGLSGIIAALLPALPDSEQGFAIAFLFVYIIPIITGIFIVIAACYLAAKVNKFIPVESIETLVRRNKKN